MGSSKHHDNLPPQEEGIVSASPVTLLLEELSSPYLT